MKDGPGKARCQRTALLRSDPLTRRCTGAARGQALGELVGHVAVSGAVGRYHTAAAADGAPVHAAPGAATRQRPSKRAGGACGGAAGAVYTWGLNDQGQLGRGATNHPHPARALRSTPGR